MCYAADVSSDRADDSGDDVEGGHGGMRSLTFSSSPSPSPSSSSSSDRPQHATNNPYLLPSAVRPAIRKRTTTLHTSDLPLPRFNSDWIDCRSSAFGCSTISCSPFKLKQQPKGGGTKTMRRGVVLSLFAFILFGGAILGAGLAAKVSLLQEELRLTDVEKAHVRAMHASVVKELVTTNAALSGMQHTYELLRTTNRKMGHAIWRFRTGGHEDDKDNNSGAVTREERNDFANKIKLVEDSLRMKIEKEDSKARAAEERTGALMIEVQEASRREVEKLYGPGPHHVKMWIEIPEGEGTVIHTIEIEMAPLEHMPHAVHTFLTQVKKKAWNGARFNAHAGHVMQAAGGGSTSLLFREFSHKYPHAKYTVAFHGDSLGGALYVNAKHNHEHHRPDRSGGVGEENDKAETGEPCFGNIVVGRDTVDLMDGMAAGPDGTFDRPAIVRRASIVMPSLRNEK